MFFVGIDWADEKHTIVILVECSKHISSFEIPHSYEGIKEFIERLDELSIPVDNAYCFIETSRGLLVSALLQHGFKAYPLNPKVVDRQCKLLKLADKHGVVRLEAAYAKALSYIPRPSFQSIKTILTTGQDRLETQPERNEPSSSSENHGFIRGADYYGRG
ncbi:transposase [Paenibacillus sp. 11B]|uniref:IS110 family transposase n=1 Tax=Paenibacillus sp. 11B TaxID=3060965 RepID=UPI0026506C4E|nr:transposase [Paenibacillus sp. 11B]MDN8588146.1 transposase [Paenibacillus sp. 11B]